MKRFNTVGQCIPRLHYMVNIEEKLKKIKSLVDSGHYFVINRARQYGKTTTLKALAEYLREEYIVISLDFQRMSQAKFKDENTFSIAFTAYFLNLVKSKKKPILGLDEECLREWREESQRCGENFGMTELFNNMSNLCDTAEKPIVLMIDEADSASNNQVFLDFLAQLWGYYLDRDSVSTFHSVILAGVYDIKNLKLKLRPEAEHRYNSPWNIAEPFDVDMSFSVSGIAGMLEDYEQDHHTGMDIAEVAQCIYDYTAGYPFLVSNVCKTIDLQISEEKRFQENHSAWSESGVAEAVKVILKSANVPLFESMVKQLDIYPMLRNIILDILYQGKQIPFSPDVEAVNMGLMFGFLKEKNGVVAIANRMFEMRLLNMFITEEASQSKSYQATLYEAKKEFVTDEKLNMERVLEKFVEHYTDVYSGNDQDFVERQGRKLFLLYLKPIINGVGNYYVEAETRDMERTDIIVDYLGEQFIIELKIWHGEKYNARGEEQLAGYLDHYHARKGYLLTFSFNQKKEAGVRTVRYEDKIIVEAVV